MKRLILLLLAAGVSFAAAQEKVTLDIGAKKEKFLGFFQRPDKGILCIAQNPYKKAMTLSFIGTGGQLMWEKPVLGEQLGYIDNYSDTRELYVFMAPSCMYIVHTYRNAFSTITPYVLRVDYSGNVKPMKASLRKNLGIERYFLVDDAVHALCSEYAGGRKVLLDLSLDESKFVFGDEHPVNVSESIAQWKISEIRNGMIYYYGSRADYKHDHRSELFLIGIEPSGEVITNESYSVDAPKEYTLLPDYRYEDVSGIAKDIHGHFDFTEKDSSYYVYGLLSRYMRDVRETGFYVQKYDSGDSLVLEKVFTFEELTRHIKDAGILKKEVNYTIHFDLDEKTGGMIFLLKEFGEKGPIYCFYLDAGGEIRTAFISRSPWFENSDRHNFFIYSQNEYRMESSPFYSDNVPGEGQPAYLKALHDALPHVAEKKKPFRGLIRLRGGDIAIDYSSDGKQITFQKL